MLLQKFQTYRMAVEYYRACDSLNIPDYLKNQLLRATASIALNLAEGSARRTPKERRRFYNIAFASLRESQAVLDLTSNDLTLKQQADSLAACLYRLCYPRGGTAPEPDTDTDTDTEPDSETESPVTESEF